ncbi:MAG TPA: D-alanyl-D-alanine carboxypeptidase/D-alanyl-D-alanine-endopeptidase [Ignavibacteriales bacterium]|nr:D-alanyl-D-alanine carboxypeptidase/D-alanyl-D-alanine-endopeptidase [Ignavibacteriales bacterium]
MKRILFLSIIFFISAYPQSLKSKLENVLKDKFFESCLISMQVEDLTSNRTLYSKNEKILLRPASNMKVLTSAAGLLFLDPDYEFSTDLYYNGVVSNDTLFGDVYVVGGCDPDFVTKDFYYFADAIKSLNISVIFGSIYGDVTFKDSLYWGKGWMWDDDPSSDAPYLSALNLNDNCVEISFDGLKDSIFVSPNTKYVSVIRIKNQDKLNIDRNWFNRKNEIIIKGQNDYKKYNGKVNVLEPAKYFLNVFSEVLDSNNVKLIGDIKVKSLTGTANLLYSFKRKYGDIISNLNKTSDNLSAEMTLYALSEKYFGKPANADSGIKIIDRLVDSVGLNPEDYRFVDGSGVSHYNVVSAELLVNILKYFYDKHPELYEILYNSFPIAGVDGTLEYRMRKTSAWNNVHAKTGTLTGVSTLSGYLTTKKNHLIAFSILMQNYVGWSSKAKDLQDEICRILAEIK